MLYRADDIAKEIYERAWAWTQASFILYRLKESHSEPIYFNNGAIMSGPLAGRYVLFCDISPKDPWPHEAWMFVWAPGPPTDTIDGWVYVNGHVDLEKSKITYVDDKTEAIQSQLDRLRLREEVMLFGLSRNRHRTTTLFKPDHSEIAKRSGVSENKVRSFFDGKRIPPDAEEKILLVAGVRPEEMGVKLWGR